MTEPHDDLSEALVAAGEATTFPELAGALRLLRASLGQPSYQSLAKKTTSSNESISAANMSDVLRLENPKPLSYKFVSRFTKALGVNSAVVKEFERAWQRIQREEVRSGAGQDAPVPEQRTAETAVAGITAEHMKTLDYFADLADGVDDDHALELAQLIHEHIYDVCRRLLGEDAERTEAAARDLGVLLLARGEYTRAHGLLWNDLNAATTRYGPDHPHTLTATENMAALHLHRGRYREAVALARHCLTSRRSQDAEADAVEYAASLLIEALKGIGDHDEAERVRRQFDADLEEHQGDPEMRSSGGSATRWLAFRVSGRRTKGS
jgi:hypothetical protein